MFDRLDRHFPRADFGPALVPVWCLTPGAGRVIHRFFDTSPLSPSGRFFAFFRFPYDDRPARPGDRGEVVVVDARTGEERVVDDTAGWEFQLGANVNWAAGDRLAYNDVDTARWEPFGVLLDPATGARRRLDGPVYHVSPDGRFALSADPLAMRRTQSGYGVVAPDDRVPVHRGPRDDAGVTLTDLESGAARLLVSTREALDRTQTGPRRAWYDWADVYAFHTKWNYDGSRLMFTLRSFPSHDDAFDLIDDATLRFDVFTMRPDGTDLHDALPWDRWVFGGHHTTWAPDNDRLTFNQRPRLGGRMRFGRVRHDGTGWETVGTFTGSGHPSFHPGGRWLVTDTYHNELFIGADGKNPIRLIDTRSGAERHVVRIPTETPGQAAHGFLRLDPHVVWIDGGRGVAFNAYADGARRVFAADLREFVGGGSA